MLRRAEEIYKKARKVVRDSQTKDALKIADDLGIYVKHIDGLKELLGMYCYRHKERHILLNSNMDPITAQMVCAHEIGHDVLHRELAKSTSGLQEFVLFDMKNELEYEANAFAAHIRIPNEELFELIQNGYDVVQAAPAMDVNINLMLIKMYELNRLGFKLDLPYFPKPDFLKELAAHV